jgi:uncharacterized membrane protein YcaP (DUF421 family)
MFAMSIAWWEFIVRALVIYIFLIISLRLSGRRQIGQLSPFDLVLLLVLSNAVQNSMNGGDNSLIGGMISALTLILLNFSVGYLTFKSKKIEKLIEGQPKILIHNGQINQQVLNEEKLTQHELDTALRQGGVLSVTEVKVAIIENNGAISIIPKKESSATVQA